MPIGQSKLKLEEGLAAKHGFNLHRVAFGNSLVRHLHSEGFEMSGVGGVGGAGNPWGNYGSTIDQPSGFLTQAPAGRYGAPQARYGVPPQSLPHQYPTQAPTGSYTAGGNAAKVAKTQGANRSQINSAQITANANILRDAGATTKEIAELRTNSSKTMQFVDQKQFNYNPNDYGYKNEKNKDGFFVRDERGYPDAPHERDI